MRHPARVRDHGFSLIEVLIALALVSVVVGLAWIILDSVSKVASEISKPIMDPMDPAWAQLEREMDALLPAPVGVDTPALRFSEEDGLEFVSLLKNAREIHLQTEVHYLLENQNLLRISRSGFPPLTQTNRVASGVQRWTVRAVHQGETFTNWPPDEEEAEEHPPLPARLTFTMERENGNSHDYDQYLPASYRIPLPYAE
ncbi:MAG: prepilin-type N-terminal cleavage/methylation domain-containing protein [Kiritimatiellia bacterium]